MGMLCCIHTRYHHYQPLDKRHGNHTRQAGRDHLNRGSQLERTPKNQSISQLISESISQSVNQQSICQSISRSASQSVNQLVYQFICLSVSQSVSQSVGQSVNQSASPSNPPIQASVRLFVSKNDEDVKKTNRNSNLCILSHSRQCCQNDCRSLDILHKWILRTVWMWCCKSTWACKRHTVRHQEGGRMLCS